MRLKVIELIHADITTAPNDTIICHQVNCQGAFDAGVAGAIADRWPEAKNHYLTITKSAGSPDKLLGRVVAHRTHDGHLILHLFAQLDCGIDKRQTDYEAFMRCLEYIRNWDLHNKFAFPWGIGCGLGGGNWKIIRTMIEEILGDYDISYYRLKP